METCTRFFYCSIMCFESIQLMALAYRVGQKQCYDYANQNATTGRPRMDDIHAWADLRA